jgi:hypothetical protein
LVYFPPFWSVVPRKIWQPWCHQVILCAKVNKTRSSLAYLIHQAGTKIASCLKRGGKLNHFFNDFFMSFGAVRALLSPEYFAVRFRRYYLDVAIGS